MPEVTTMPVALSQPDCATEAICSEAGRTAGALAPGEGFKGEPGQAGGRSHTA